MAANSDSTDGYTRPPIHSEFHDTIVFFLYNYIYFVEKLIVLTHSVSSLYCFDASITLGGILFDNDYE